MTASSSMRLLVVSASAPEISRVRPLQDNTRRPASGARIAATRPVRIDLDSSLQGRSCGRIDQATDQLGIFAPAQAQWRRRIHALARFEHVGTGRQRIEEATAQHAERRLARIATRFARRNVQVMTRGDHFKPQQRQPIAQPPFGKQATQTRRVAGTARRRAQPPQAARVGSPVR